MPSGTTTPWIESQSSRPPRSSGRDSARGGALPAGHDRDAGAISAQPGIASAASRSTTSGAGGPCGRGRPVPRPDDAGAVDEEDAVADGREHAGGLCALLGLAVELRVVDGDGRACRELAHGVDVDSRRSSRTSGSSARTPSVAVARAAGACRRGRAASGGRRWAVMPGRPRVMAASGPGSVSRSASTSSLPVRITRADPASSSGDGGFASRPSAHGPRPRPLFRNLDHDPLDRVAVDADRPPLRRRSAPWPAAPSGAASSRDRATRRASRSPRSGTAAAPAPCALPRPALRS